MVGARFLSFMPQQRPASKLGITLTANRSAFFVSDVDSKQKLLDQPTDQSETATPAVLDHSTTLGEVNQSRKLPDTADLHPVHIDGADDTAPKSEIQQFIDGAGRLNYRYSENVQDMDRRNNFQARLLAIFKGDPKTFEAMGKLGDELNGPPLTPEQLGERIGNILVNALQNEDDRAPGDLNYNSGNVKDILVPAGSGLLIAAQSVLSGTDIQQSTRAMVDRADEIVRASKYGAHIRVGTFSDNEPCFIMTPGKNEPIDRYNAPG